MCHQRDLDALAQAIAETSVLLAKLQSEWHAGWEAQREGIIRAWDDGGSRKQIAAAFGVSYGKVTNTLSKADPPRNEGQRRRAQLSEAQRPHYDKLLRVVPSRIARQIAETVAP